LKFTNKVTSDFNKQITKVVITDFIPIMRFPLANEMNKLREINENLKQFVMEKLMEHQADYQHGIIRDFADALIASREEAIKEGQENVKHLSDFNLMLTLLDLFAAGCKSLIC
jgi:Cytochrome P450